MAATSRHGQRFGISFAARDTRAGPAPQVMPSVNDAGGGPPIGRLRTWVAARQNNFLLLSLAGAGRLADAARSQRLGGGSLVLAEVAIGQADRQRHPCCLVEHNAQKPKIAH